jgi:cytochrome c6
MRRTALLLVSVSLLLLAGVALAGCGDEEEATPTPETVTGTVTDTTETETDETETTDTGEEPAGDPAAGKTVFLAQCGTCHTLADAGTSGTVGPDLDESQPDAELVVDRVTNGAGVMPAFGDQLSETEIQNVAAYVVDATG